MLHMTRVAFGADGYAALLERIAGNAAGDLIRLTTRYRPKRHAEIVGGSLYWIIKHRLVGRCEVVGFEEAEGGRTHIVLKAELVAVEPVARRAHQGWRYLNEDDAPGDLDAAAQGNALPTALLTDLADLGLV
jgi:hypothetical protein